MLIDREDINSVEKQFNHVFIDLTTSVQFLSQAYNA